MQLSAMPREKKKNPANSPYFFFFLLKKIQYGKTSYAWHDQT
jgi:hypothetical protein